MSDDYLAAWRTAVARALGVRAVSAIGLEEHVRARLLA